MRLRTQICRFLGFVDWRKFADADWPVPWWVYSVVKVRGRGGAEPPTSVISPHLNVQYSPSTSKLSPSPHASLPGNIVDFSSLTRFKYSIKLTDFSGCLTICVEDYSLFVDPVLIAVVWVWLCFVLLLCQLSVESSIKSAPKCIIHRGKFQKNFLGGGTAPSPDPTLLGRGTPLPRPYPRGLRPLDRPSPTQPPTSCWPL